jgi:hypothetical protein
MEYQSGIEIFFWDNNNFIEIKLKQIMKFNSQWTNIEEWKKINGKQKKLKVLKKKKTVTNYKIDFLFCKFGINLMPEFFSRSR